MELRPGYNYHDPNANKRRSNGEARGPIRFPELTNSEVEEDLYGWPEGRE